MTPSKHEKGYATEEAIRRYFSENGYFAVRGVPFAFRGFDVTDIDVWAYSRTSPLARYRLIVDCKNRSTPRAIERIFWVKGLQEALGVDGAAIATTEKRPEVADFGRRTGVLVIDGNFLSELSNKPSEEYRLSEEEFTTLLLAYSPAKNSSDWKTRIKASKQPLAYGPSFSSVNYWLDVGRFFAEQMLLVANHRETACRACFLLASFVAMGLDFSMREFALLSPEEKQVIVEQGLRNGSSHSMGATSVISMATRLIEQYAPESRAVAVKIRQRVGEDLDRIPTKQIAEYICKPAVYSNLFDIARALEQAAYKRGFSSPDELGNSSKAFFFLLLDFWGIDRVKAAEVFDEKRDAAHPISDGVQESLPGITSDSSTNRSN